MQSTHEPLTITVQQAQQLSNLGHTTIYEMLKDGRLKAVTIGRRRLIDYASLKAVLKPQAG